MPATRSPSRLTGWSTRGSRPGPASVTATDASESSRDDRCSPRNHAHTRSSELGSVGYDRGAAPGHRVAQADQVACEREHRVGIVALVGHVAGGDVAVGEPRLDARRRRSPRRARRSTASVCARDRDPSRAPWNTPTGSSTRSSGMSVSGMPIRRRSTRNGVPRRPISITIAARILAGRRRTSVSRTDGCRDCRRSTPATRSGRCCFGFLDRGPQRPDACSPSATA